MSNKILVRLYAEHVGKVSDKWSIYFHEYDLILGAYRTRRVRLARNRRSEWRLTRNLVQVLPPRPEAGGL